MPLPLTEFTLERFRGIHDLELKQLGRVNLLLGPNNSGKTSVLEALILYGRPLDPVAWQGVSALRDGFILRDLGALRWLFPARAEDMASESTGASSPQCSLRGQGEFSVQRVEATYKSLARLRASPQTRQPSTTLSFLGVAPSHEDHGSQGQFGAELSIAVSLASRAGLQPERRLGVYTFWFDESFVRQGSAPEPKLPVEFVSPYGHQLEYQLVEKFKRTTLTGEQSQLLGLLRRLDSTIEHIESLPGINREASLYFKMSDGGYLPISVMGDGIRRALALALALLETKGGLVLVDELESAFHFSALRRVFSWLVEACHQYDVQLFATTHSLEAIDAILASDMTEEEDVVAYRLEREGQSHHAVRLGEGELRLLRNQLGQEVR